MTQIVYAGVDVGGTFVKIGLVTKEGEILNQTQIPTEAENPAAEMLKRAAKAIQKLIQDQGGCELKATGIGTAGSVSVEKGILYEAPNMPNWKDISVGEILSNELGVPVVVDNDANAAAWGEYGYGAGRGSQYMLLVTLGTGVGGGLVLDGKPYRGAIDAGGEFGHTAIDYDGWMCSCGCKGCVEAYVGTKGILRQVREGLESHPDSLLANIDPNKMMPVDVSQAADQGDTLALRVLEQTGIYLGYGLANAVNLLNIQRIVVGGGVAKAGDRILKPAFESMKANSMRVLGGIVDLVPAQLGNSAGLVGAAWLAAFEAGDLETVSSKQ
jgi:glucokinase